MITGILSVFPGNYSSLHNGIRQTNKEDNYIYKNLPRQRQFKAKKEKWPKFPLLNKLDLGKDLMGEKADFQLNKKCKLFRFRVMVKTIKNN